MMDRGRAQNINEAAARFAETLADSYRLVYEQAAQSGERQRRLAQEFSELVAQNLRELLREQTESGRAAAERLSEQVQRQQEAGRELAQESVEAYVEFLDEAFSQYRSGTQKAAQSAQETTRNLSETATGLIGTATGTAGSVADTTAEATRSTAEAVAGQPPVEDYDELNVEEVTARLDGLSEAELMRVRNYEQRNQNRQTVLDQVDTKLQSAS